MHAYANGRNSIRQLSRLREPEQGTCLMYLLTLMQSLLLSFGSLSPHEAQSRHKPSSEDQGSSKQSDPGLLDGDD